MPRELEVAIGKRLRFYRIQKGISQTELGDQVGLTYQQIQKYERGANRLSTSRLVEFAEFLEFSLADFFDGLTAREREAGESPIDEMKEALVQPYMIDLVRQFGRIDSNAMRRSFVDLLESYNDERSS